MARNLKPHAGPTFCSAKKFSVYAYVPIAILRDRTQSVADIRTTNNTGIYTHGDAAFSDYSLNIGASFRF